MLYKKVKNRVMTLNFHLSIKWLWDFFFFFVILSFLLLLLLLGMGGLGHYTMLKFVFFNPIGLKGWISLVQTWQHYNHPTCIGYSQAIQVHDVCLCVFGIILCEEAFEVFLQMVIVVGIVFNSKYLKDTLKDRVSIKNIITPFSPTIFFKFSKNHN